MNKNGLIFISMERSILKIESRKLGKRGQLPDKYTCHASNVNLPLKIENIPPATKSIAVVMESFDRDGVSRTHWIAYNIPITGSIRENELRGDTGLNDFGGKGYWGPGSISKSLECTFRVYALDRFLNFSNKKVCKFDLEGGIRYYGLGHGKLVCNYAKNRVLKNLQRV